MKKILLFLIIILFILGFTPYHDLNNIQLVDTLAVEKINNEYILYLNIVNNKNKVYKLKGKSLGEAFSKAEIINHKKTYYKHLQVVIIKNNLINNKTLTFFKNEFSNINYLILTTNESIKKNFKKYTEEINNS